VSVTADNTNANSCFVRRCVEVLQYDLSHDIVPPTNSQWEFGLGCAAHIVNLIVREGLKDIEPATRGVRNLIGYIRSSPNRQLNDYGFRVAYSFAQKRRRELNDLFEPVSRDCYDTVHASTLTAESLLEVQFPAIVVDNDIRWNSTAHMLSRALELRDGLAQWYEWNKKELSTIPPLPSNADWDAIEKVSEFLTFFHDGMFIIH
jgi:hypothetical protein